MLFRLSLQAFIASTQERIIRILQIYNLFKAENASFKIS